MEQIKEIEINELSDFVSHFEKKENFAPNHYLMRQLFRGQPNIEWPLIPSYFRLRHSWNPLIAENLLLSNFKRMSKGILKYYPTNDLEWMTIAQHHGLPTRLLDWTYNSLVALFFSLEDSTKDGVVYHIIIEEPDLENATDVKKIINSEIPVYIKPEHISQRISAQGGCFLLMPFPDRKFPSSKFSYKPLDYYYEKSSELSFGAYDMRKFVIKKEIKGKLQNRLNDIGINYFTLFPDLDGLSKHLKYEMMWK